ncbi:unnamed protein product [Haemonchus placei]|uniref:Uncharacterized protein n=1 Tax=Haemonchus placei TaxID=6290 RepID=A0A0N4VT23_HAEPC|nr:unnamed protein product [Haemonchus placei]
MEPDLSPGANTDYAQNRIEMNQDADLAKKSAALMSSNITSMIRLIESSSEPSHGPAAHPRRQLRAYLKETMSEYLEVIMEYKKSEVRLPVLVEKPMRSARAERVRRTSRKRERGADSKNTTIVHLGTSTTPIPKPVNIPKDTSDVHFLM